MLVKSFGQFWNPDIVDWGPTPTGAGQLIGDVDKGKYIYEIDFWNAKGIYVLYSDYKPIYVGKAFGTSIGRRLKDHLGNRLAGRWDMFSWYSVSTPRFTRYDVSQPGKRYIAPSAVIDTFEALAILIADPALNRRREVLKDAYEAVQPEGVRPRTVRSYLQEILAKVNAP